MKQVTTRAGNRKETPLSGGERQRGSRGVRRGSKRGGGARRRERRAQLTFTATRLLAGGM